MKTTGIIVLLICCTLFSLNISFAQDSTAAVAGGVVRANTKFGIDLFKKLTAAADNQNVIISPASVLLALAMAYNGAGGTTQEAMARTLGLDSLNPEEVNASFASLLTALPARDSLIQLLIANSLWADKRIAFKRDFIDRTKTFYQAELNNLDFASPASPSVINSWVSRKTHDKIKSIVGQIKSDVILFLIDAIYFKGNWSTPFDEKSTTDRPFHHLNGTDKPVRMMKQGGSYQYFHAHKIQAIALPYGKGGMSMVVILPDSDMTLDQFTEQRLNRQSWEEWMTELRLAGGNIELPRFTLENDFLLNQALMSLGMEEAFDERNANFKPMVEANDVQNVYISGVRQKTFIEVNEKGSEAAAVTSVEVSITAAFQTPKPPFKMVVDRPFFFAIRDNESGMLLFMGSIVDP
jgi:serpin B